MKESLKVGKDHSITLVLFNDRYQKVLNLLKKHLIIWRGIGCKRDL